LVSIFTTGREHFFSKCGFHRHESTRRRCGHCILPALVLHRAPRFKLDLGEYHSHRAPLITSPPCGGRMLALVFRQRFWHWARRLRYLLLLCYSVFKVHCGDISPLTYFPSGEVKWAKLFPLLYFHWREGFDRRKTQKFTGCSYLTPALSV
jgi:hypothetical protein